MKTPIKACRLKGYFLLGIGMVLSVLAQPSAAAGEPMEANGESRHGEGHYARYEKKELKEKVRDPRKAAREMRKNLREEGVRNVRVKSPSQWPKKVPVPEDTQLKEGETPEGVQGFFYESNHYIFSSPVALSDAGQQMIGRLFECTYAASKEIAHVLPVPRAEAERGKDKYKVRLVRDKAEYYAAGGAKGSSGVFIHRRKEVPEGQGLQESDIVADFVLVPFDSLGLDTHGKMVKADINTHTLVHEITHQNFVLNNLPIWANEGWAEYVGYVPYVGEDLDFDRGFSLILHTAKSRAGTGALDYPFSLGDFFAMEQEEMYSYMPQGKDTYLLGAMLVAFYVHLDGTRGLDAIRSYMEKLVEGASAEEATRELVTPYKGEKKLQAAFLKAWKRKKVEMSFPDVK